MLDEGFFQWLAAPSITLLTISSQTHLCLSANVTEDANDYGEISDWTQPYSQVPSAQLI